MATATVTTPHPIYLAGRWVESPDVLVVDDPAHPGTPAGATYTATEAQYEEAVEAAVAAFEQTRRLSSMERSRALHHIETRHPDPSRGAGPGHLRGSRASPSGMRWVRSTGPILTFRLGAEEAERITGETIPLDLNAASRGRVGITRRFPVGPVAAISPFNFPLNLAAHKVAPAIAAGCSIVLKPPPATR